MARASIVFETPFDTFTSSRVLGEGGAGRVHVVTNSNGEEYAVKCLAAERITTERRKRFKNEIEFCQQTNYPNIIKVLDTGSFLDRDTKCPFYVMKRYSGTLRTLIPNVEPDAVLQLFSQILDGVEAAHLMGVWHRDLKPENILYDDQTNRLVIADFGIAHFEEEEIYTAVETKVAARMANFQYAAPEQRVRGDQVDHRCDIFALGLILNELFTKQIPLGAGFPTIEKASAAHAYLDDLVSAMLQQAPDSRPQSIDVIKRELIGRKNSFIARQEYDTKSKKVVSASATSPLEPIVITEFDYEKGVVKLKLSNNVPSGWSQEYQRPRDGHRSIMGYGPEAFSIRGNIISIPVQNDQGLIQQIVNFAKEYVDAANRGYAKQLKERSRQEEQQQRAELEKEIAEAEFRKNVLENVKL